MSAPLFSLAHFASTCSIDGIAVGKCGGVCLVSGCRFYRCASSLSLRRCLRHVKAQADCRHYGCESWPRTRAYLCDMKSQTVAAIGWRWPQPRSCRSHLGHTSSVTGCGFGVPPGPATSPYRCALCRVVVAYTGVMNAPNSASGICYSQKKLNVSSMGRAMHAVSKHTYYHVVARPDAIGRRALGTCSLRSGTAKVLSRLDIVHDASPLKSVQQMHMLRTPEFIGCLHTVRSCIGLEQLLPP